MVHGPQVGLCRVCGEMTTIHSTASCMRCNSTFHLALRQDIPDKDCGQVWIGEESQTLEFACDICLGLVQPTGAGTQQSSIPAAEPPSRTRYARRDGARVADIVREKRRRV